MKRLLIGFILASTLLALLIPASLNQTASAIRIHTNTSSNASSLITNANLTKEVDAIDAVTLAGTEYIERINAIEDAGDSIGINSAREAGEDLRDKITALQQQSFDLNSSDDYIRATQSLKTSTAKLNTATKNLNSALKSKDADTINSALEKYNSASKSFDASIDLYNTFIQNYNEPILEERRETGTLYIVVSVISIIVTIATFSWRPEWENAHQESLRKSAAKQSLWPLGGALITTIWFFVSSSGYIIFWGAVIVGFIIYIKALADALIARKNPGKDIAQMIKNQTDLITPQLAKIFNLNTGDAELKLITALTLEGLYAYSLFNTPFSNTEEALQHERYRIVTQKINELLSIDGEAEETVNARETIFKSIAHAITQYAEHTLESKRTFAVLGAASFLVKEYAGHFSFTNPDASTSSPVIKNLATYQLIVNSYI